MPGIGIVTPPNPFPTPSAVVQPAKEFAFNSTGHSPEMIVANYPTLSLSLVHKTIAFYLDHLPDVDEYVAEHDRIIAEQMATARPAPTVKELRSRLEAKRKAEVQPSELS